MAKRPAFGDLRKTKPAPEPGPATASQPEPAAAPAPARIQTSVRLEPAMWAALNDLATQKRVQTGRRVTVHDLLIEGARYILAVSGIKLPE